jgi:hypothetical protein
MPPRVEFLAIETGDANGFLTAMLEGMKPQRGHRRRVACAQHAENAAFLAQLVAVAVFEGIGGDHVSRKRPRQRLAPEPDVSGASNGAHVARFAAKGKACGVPDWPKAPLDGEILPLRNDLVTVRGWLCPCGMAWRTIFSQRGCP